MKHLRSILFAFTVLLLATATQAQEPRVRATVPFDFILGDQTYPAGEYSLGSIANNLSVVRIVNTQEATTKHVLSHACTRLDPSEKSKLVFHRMGDNYFLYQIWVEGYNSGREFPMGRTEIRLAQNHLKPEVVIVAANISH